MSAEQRVVIVTAASAGMGAACARELARRGDRVSLFARSEATESLAAELGGMATLGSVENLADLERLVEATLSRYGRVDALVANTGHPAKGELLSITDDEWHAGLDLLLLPVVRLARLLTPGFEAQKRGAIVAISSFAAREPSLPRPVSSALRAALGSFTKMYAELYAARGIRMNAVLPGWVDSYPVDPAIVDSIPMKRPAGVDEIARVVAFLLSDEASYLTGVSLPVDGGLLRFA